nr:BRO family protein [Segatella copri]
MNTSICCYLCMVYTNNAVYQLVNQYDTLKQGAWVVTGIKKDGSEAMRRTLMLYVNESGFYALVLGSKLSTAVKFKNWVTADVLPQIRKTGGYPCLLLHLDIDLG